MDDTSLLPFTIEKWSEYISVLLLPSWLYDVIWSPSLCSRGSFGVGLGIENRFRFQNRTLMVRNRILVVKLKFRFRLSIPMRFFFFICEDPCMNALHFRTSLKCILKYTLVQWFAKKRHGINVWYHYLITLESKLGIEIDKIQTIPNPSLEPESAQ